MSRRLASLVWFAVVFTFAGGVASFGSDKLATYALMSDLARQMEAIKSDADQAAAYRSLEAQYRQLSASMGGDDPATMNTGPAGHGTRVPNGLLPANCGSSGGTFSATDVPVAIADLAVSTSTVNVSGTGNFLFAVSVTTDLTHTFAADLDITLQSPAGTVVTLTTDNGAGNDNVFAGTDWRDDASDTATDFVYANLTVAPELVPEEAMGAFYGEDPNGTWTLTVSDDLTGDSGTINSWSVHVTALTATPIAVASSHPSTDTPVAIADVATSTSTLAVAGLDTFVCKVAATANITHTFAADMDISLTSPGGAVAVISTDNGAGNDNVFAGTLWDDEVDPSGQVPYTTHNGITTDQAYANLTLATPLVAEGAMGRFRGTNPNGNWILTVVDDLSGDTGTINSWNLEVTTCSCVIPDADLQVSKIGALGGGSTVIWTIGVSNAGPGDATGVVVTDALDACSTYISDDCGGSNLPPWTWNVGGLANGASATCNVTVDTSSCGLAVANTASATGAENDPTPLNNSATATLTVASTVEIPTLDAVGLGVLALVLASGAIVVLRRRRQA